MDDQNANDEIFQRMGRFFRTQQRPFLSHHDALGVLEQPWNRDLTLIGALLDEAARSETGACRSTSWINVELHVPELEDSGGRESGKADRMRPVAIRRRHVGAVTKLHKEFFDNPKAWERKIRREKWLTLSDIMNEWQEPFVDDFVVCIGDADYRTFRNSGAYKNGHLALIHIDDRGRYVLEHRTLSNSIPVNECYGRQVNQLERMVRWLSSYNGKDVETICYYCGTQRRGSTTRVYSGLTESASGHNIAWVAHVAEIIHRRYVSILTDALVAGKLEDFWKATKDLVPHEKSGFPPAANALRRFLGLPLGSQWPLGLRKQQIRDCLITMCGKGSCFEGGDEPLSVVGAALLLLGAVARQRGTCCPALDMLPREVTNRKLSRDMAVLPVQEASIARQSAVALFDVFRLAVWPDSDEQLPPLEAADRLQLLNGTLSDNGLEITVDIDAQEQQSAKSQRSELASAVIHALRARIKGFTEERDTTYGGLAKAIVNYWLTSCIRNGAQATDGQFFPCGGITVCAKQGKTQIRVDAYDG